MLKIIIVFFVLLLLALFLNWSNKSLTVTKYVFQSPQVHDSFDGFRIVQVSDLQSEYFGSDQEELIDAVRQSEPDIIVFTGDLVDRTHTDYEASLKAMEGLAKIAPVYYVNGNHELALPEEKIAQMYSSMEEMGIKLLMGCRSSVERNGEKIYIAGLAEEAVLQSKESGQAEGQEFEKTVIDEEIEKLTGAVDEEDLVILLVHEPQLIEAYAGEKIDLVFAGHAHGGQIRLPFTEGLFAPGQGVLPKLTSGLHYCGQTGMIISRGLGNSVFPFRVFNRPEIVVTQLKKA